MRRILPLGQFKVKMRQLEDFSMACTDPIERPPVPGYRKIDADQTIRDNTDRAGFDKLEETVRDHVAKYNSGKLSLSHVEANVKTQGVCMVTLRRRVEKYDILFCYMEDSSIGIVLKNLYCLPVAYWWRVFITFIGTISHHDPRSHLGHTLSCFFDPRMTLIRRIPM